MLGGVVLEGRFQDQRVTQHDRFFSAVKLNLKCHASYSIFSQKLLLSRMFNFGPKIIKFSPISSMDISSMDILTRKYF